MMSEGDAPSELQALMEGKRVDKEKMALSDCKEANGTLLDPLKSWSDISHGNGVSQHHVHVKICSFSGV